MTPVDWMALALGGAAGLTMSAIFFLGLALGISRALKAQNTTKALVFSAIARIAMFLAGGWVIITLAGPWAFLGYGLAFFVTRQIALTMARLPVRGETAE